MSWAIGWRFAAWVTLLLAPICGAQPHHDRDRMAQAIEVAQDNVRQATRELNALRDALASKRKPLAAELESLRIETLRLRGEIDRLRTTRAQDEAAGEALAREVTQMREAYGFHYMLLQEYRRSFETRQDVAESQCLGPRLKEMDDQLLVADTREGFVAATDGLLRLAEEWNLQKLGGAIHPGWCLDPEGTQYEGAFAVLGPVSYFASSSGDVAGLVVNQVGSGRPSLYSDLDPKTFEAIALLIRGARVDVPIDPTGGDALKVAVQKTSLKDHLLAGGLVMIPLLSIGVVAGLLTVLKLVTLGRLRTPGEDILDRVATYIRVDQIAEAQDLIDGLSSPFRAVLSAGIGYQGVPDDHLEEILQERALATIPSLDRHLGMLAVLGGIAPLLGLLGTVTGMIHTFELVTIFGTGDAKLLSGGISEALVTTEIGLIIAVPILLIHAVLTRRVRTVISALEQTIVGFMHCMHKKEVIAE